MLKKVKMLIASILIMGLMSSSSVVLANGMYSNSSTKGYSELVKKLINDYDSRKDALNKVKIDRHKSDGRFVNDMAVKQKKNYERINYEIEKAKKNNEKLYSYDNILALKEGDLGLSKNDLQYIKSSITNTVKKYEKLYEEFEREGKQNHPIAKSLKKALSVKYPKSLIYVDKSSNNIDGMISGGGWPYCLDDNGWGYRNFINSDCFWSLVYYPYCWGGSTHMSSLYWLRYCKAYVINCSPLIGHSPYWHTH